MAHAEGSYYIPHGSHWPIVGSIGLTTLLVSFSSYLNGAQIGTIGMAVGVLITLFMMFGWFSVVVKESESGAYNEQVDRSFRWGMFWFIVSEVMFFAAFFGALFYVRMLSTSWLLGEGTGVSTHEFLWPAYSGVWPEIGGGPGHVGGAFEAMPAWGVPALNTFILLTSGATITWAHWGLKENKRLHLILGLAATVVLGFLFMGFQVFEYMEAYHDMNLKLTTGTYGSTFFMLTGFHGMHVTIGAIMLTVMLLRALKGHFTPKQHFAFEAASWYWHFVDVVWLGLFIFVYWL